MNATIQCLKVVPELRAQIKSFSEDFQLGASESSRITQSIKTVFNLMDGSNTVNPMMLLHALHRAFPQFAQTGENGAYRQQVRKTTIALLE